MEYTNLSNYLNGCLQDSVNEGVRKTGSFIKSTDVFDNLIKYAPHLKIANIKDGVEDIKNLFDEIISKKSYESKYNYIWSDIKSYFKMNYEFTPIIKTIVKTRTDVYIKDLGGEKIALYYIVNGKGVKLMETGKGSVGRVRTDVQENSTCAIFNDYIKHVDDDELSKLSDLDYIRNIVADMYDEEVDNMDKSWIASFGRQIKAIVTYIKSFGGDPRNYRLTRYGEGDDVSKAYANMVDTYTKSISESTGEKSIKKDSYDPTDVILYDVTKINEFKRFLKGCTMATYSNVRENFLNKVFTKHLCMGVSLKKINSNNPKYDVFNVGADNVVQSVNSIKKGNNGEIIHETDKGVYVVCEGKFNFEKYTDLDKESVGKNNEVRVTLRSFGGNNIGINVKLNEPNEPALGKCPVNEWRTILKIDKHDSKDIEKAKQAFINVANSGDLKAFEDIIKFAIKEGPSCFPFVLIH